MTQRRSTRIIIAVILVVGAGLSRLAPAQAPAKKKPSTAARPSTSTAVATVGGVPIPRSDFEERARQGQQLYETRSSAQMPAELRSMFRRQILETLIREQLILHEVRRRGLTLTTAQAEELLKKEPFFNRNGIFDEARYLAVKSTQPEQFNRAVAQIQSTYGALKVKAELERENSPDPAALRARLERDLSQSLIEFVAVPRTATDPTVEPREDEVLEYFRSHRQDYKVPAEAHLQILLVNRPPLGLHADQSAVQAWETRMRQRADSLIGVVRRGTPITQLSEFGELREAEVGPGRFPPFWIGGASTQEQALRTPSGGVMSEAVRGERSWMVVAVKEQHPARLATLGEVSGSIRSLLRERAAARDEANDIARIYESMRDSLRGPAHRIRYAIADTGRIAVPEPSAADIDRYYRGHQADYTHFDRATSSLHAKPLSEVRDDVRARLMRERRQAAARTAVDQVYAAWSKGQRDKRAERAMTAVREVGPVPVDAPVDTGLAGQALSDSLTGGPRPDLGRLRYSAGWVVYHVIEEVPNHLPTLEQCRPLLLERRTAMLAAEEERAARQAFERNPQAFQTGDVVRFSRLMVEPPDPATVSLTREDVENWYKSHIADYGAPELCHARHILMRPRDGSPEADVEARTRAEAALARAKAGEPFTRLAAELSDDEATRDAGGDVGVFRRGMMLDAFEQVAFTMSVGDIRGPVKTEVGYHVIECLEATPAEVVPLKYAYANVAAEAAREKSRRIGRFRADSLLRVLRTRSAARAAARRLDYPIYNNEHTVGDRRYLGELADYFLGIEKLRPGQFHPKIQEYRGMGYAVTWCDTVLPPRTATWEEAHDRAMEIYRNDATRTGMLARKAELDSLTRAGWSVDSVAGLLGGYKSQSVVGVGNSLGSLGGSALLDSLLSGVGGRPPVLKPGQISDWVEFPGGLARVRLLERKPPDPVTLASRVESQQRLELETNLRLAFDKLKQRYPVRILDHDLEITELPPLVIPAS